MKNNYFLILQYFITHYLGLDLVRFFGALVSALYKVKESQNELKHFVVYEEAAEYLGNYPHIMEDIFNLSLEITRISTVISKVEQHVLEFSRQVSIFVIDILHIFLNIIQLGFIILTF